MGSSVDPTAMMVQEMQNLRTMIEAQKSQFEEQMAALKKENAALHTELKNSRTNNQLNSSTTIPTPTIGTTPAPNELRRPRPVHPDVEPFTGEDSRSYPPFRMNLRTKFTIDAACYPDETSKVYYTYS